MIDESDQSESSQKDTISATSEDDGRTWKPDEEVETYPQYKTLVTDIVAASQGPKEWNVLDEKLADGWKTDRQFSENPKIFGKLLIYHLIKLDPNPEEVVEIEAEIKGKYSDVIDVQYVNHMPLTKKEFELPKEQRRATVAEWVEHGYEIHDIFSKTTNMILRRKPEDPVMVREHSIHIDKIDLPKEEKKESESKTDKQIYR